MPLKRHPLYRGLRILVRFDIVCLLLAVGGCTGGNAGRPAPVLTEDTLAFSSYPLGNRTYRIDALALRSHPDTVRYLLRLSEGFAGDSGPAWRTLDEVPVTMGTHDRIFTELCSDSSGRMAFVGVADVSDPTRGVYPASAAWRPDPQLARLVPYQAEGIRCHTILPLSPGQSFVPRYNTRLEWPFAPGHSLDAKT
jgi:hypothetical protein